VTLIEKQNLLDTFVNTLRVGAGGQRLGSALQSLDKWASRPCLLITNRSSGVAVVGLLLTVLTRRYPKGRLQRPVEGRPAQNYPDLHLSLMEVVSVSGLVGVSLKMHRTNSWRSVEAVGGRGVVQPTQQIMSSRDMGYKRGIPAGQAPCAFPAAPGQAHIQARISGPLSLSHTHSFSLSLSLPPPLPLSFSRKRKKEARRERGGVCVCACG